MKISYLLHSSKLKLTVSKETKIAFLAVETLKLSSIYPISMHCKEKSYILDSGPLTFVFKIKLSKAQFNFSTLL